MTSAPDRTARLCAALIAAAAPLAPADIRRDWRREWEAEVGFTARPPAPRREAAGQPT